jgi:hypothetical protein
MAYIVDGWPIPAVGWTEANLPGFPKNTRKLVTNRRIDARSGARDQNLKLNLQYVI